MAAVSQTITPAPTIQSFAGLPASVNNIYPRARVNFDDATSITLKAAGNTNVVIYAVNLPANFAYRIDTMSVSFALSTSTEVSQFEDLGAALVTLQGVSFFRMVLKSEGLVSSGSVVGASKTWTLVEPLAELFHDDSGTETQLLLRLFDNDAVNETVALGSIFHMSFLQYDIEQEVEVVVNAPMPVRVQ